MKSFVIGGCVAAALVLAGCGGSGPARPDATAGQHHGATPALDSIVVLGHSGTTGYNSDPAQPGEDAPANSWATGTNPAVESIYRRLLATHPALEGHTTSLGQDGSTVHELAGQVDSMLALDPLPDLVIIQTIDNDMQCDGTDAANEQAFGKTLGDVLTDINKRDPGAQIFLVDQWGSVATYTRATQHQSAAVSAASGQGPCDTFTADGKVRPAGIASEQRIVDGYYAQVEKVCAAHRSCWTDRAALQRMPLETADLTPDFNHLSVAGQHAMAAAAWDALPAEIKDRK